MVNLKGNTSLSLIIRKYGKSDMPKDYNQLLMKTGYFIETGVPETLITNPKTESGIDPTPEIQHISSRKHLLAYR